MRRLRFYRGPGRLGLASESGFDMGGETDSFQWLEEDTEQVLSWQTEQDARTATYLSSLPTYAAFNERVTMLGDTGSLIAPKFAGGRWFRVLIPDGQNLQVL